MSVQGDNHAENGSVSLEKDCSTYLHMDNQGGLYTSAATEGVEQLLIGLDLLQDGSLDLLSVLPHCWDGLN